jgi:hypothetical protein
MWVARNKDGDLRIFSHKPTLSNTLIKAERDNCKNRIAKLEAYNEKLVR